MPGCSNVQVAHLFEIADQRGASRVPSEPLPGLRTGSRQIQTRKGREPSPRFLRRQRDHRHVQAAADGRCNIADRDPLFGDRMIARASRFSNAGR
jgi:hypothetical protein